MTKKQLKRFMDRIEIVTESGCWIWMGDLSKGYGRFWMNRESFLAHRASYKHFIGTIPKKLTMDHLCRVRCCVNPHHLEPVSNLENTMRGECFSAQKARQTHCVRGHEFTNENTHIAIDPLGRRHRQCKECHRTYQRKNGPRYKQNRKLREVQCAI